MYQQNMTLDGDVHTMPAVQSAPLHVYIEVNPTEFNRTYSQLSSYMNAATVSENVIWEQLLHCLL